MQPTWPPTVGARVRPVKAAPEDVSPGGDPIPAPGAGPMWARLRYAGPSNGCDKREAMVSDCDNAARWETEIGGGGSTSGGDGDGGGGGGGGGGRTVSVVWEDGVEEDGVAVSGLGPCAELPAPSSAEGAGAVGGEEVEAAAAAARERGNARFRSGDVAAAAAEYVEACAWLVSALPPGAAGPSADWFIPGATANATAADDADDGGYVVVGAPAPAPAPATATAAGTGAGATGATGGGGGGGGGGCARPTVGMRVRVQGADGAARTGMVSYVELEEGMCDVMFDEVAPGEEEEEEVGVPFERVFGVSGGGGGVSGGVSGASGRTGGGTGGGEEEEDDDGETRRRWRAGAYTRPLCSST